ncbi:THO complex subunit 7 [Orchesella cincta]|uniref:THO complex subunit 7 n=1 Tax=Orchesella cincta TaxID=48709 RepID=A0A1D2NBP8_ORCCI|nr:THO complex subunit 7 [Orchesella cincta]
MANSSDNALTVETKFFLITEEIIKRRLLIDGDGMGDERKLNTLIKSYISFLDGEDTEENDLANLRRIQTQVRQMELVVRRTDASITANLDAKEIYTELKDKVQTEITETQEKIVTSKASLEEATKHRKYSMEYDALAKLIESKPDRKATELKRMGLELELDTLQRRESKLDQQLEYRKRTASMMGSTIERLKDLMEYQESQQGGSAAKSPKASSSRNGGISMDVDSTSQSEPPSPMDQNQSSLDGINGTTSVEKVIIQPQPSSLPAPGNGNGAPTEKSKSEKYEDLSESEGDENS